MWKRIRTISAIVVALCLVLGLNVLPVNADSNQNPPATVAPALPSPPSNFNPLTATNAELQQYGFPSRPVDPAALAQWENVMSHCKYYGKPEQTPSDTTSFGLQKPINYSYNWAGFATTSLDNNGATFTEASGYWTQPNYLDTFYGDPILWTGIGGYQQGNPIVQAGTDCNGTFWHAPVQNICWVEDFPYRRLWESYPVITPGDNIFVNVTYGGTVSTAFFADLSNGQYTSVPFWTPDYDNTSAEYIWEDVDGMDAPNTSGTFRGCATLGPNGNLPLYYANYREFIVTSDGTSTGVPWAWPTSIPNSDSGFTIDTNP
ncbi:MAG: G1 family glutamic endopeptidase [Dehalococcoidales bacterium]